MIDELKQWEYDKGYEKGRKERSDNMYINIVELLESIKEACGKTKCKDCPFSGTYRHKGKKTDFHYCKIAEIPNGWQIDSTQDAEVLCDITDFERHYNMKEG